MWLDILKAAGSIGGIAISAFGYLRSASRKDVARLQSEVSAIRVYIGMLHSRLITFLDTLDGLINHLPTELRAPLRGAVETFRQEVCDLRKQHTAIIHGGDDDAL